MEPAYPDLGGAHSWGFMRWNLVDALFRYGWTGEAALLLERWAIQEDGSHFQAPEGFPTVTGVTGLGYVWTAARSLCALLFGLGGIRLTGGGLVLAPRLPAGWGAGPAGSAAVPRLDLRHHHRARRRPCAGRGRQAGRLGDGDQPDGRFRTPCRQRSPRTHMT
jgi:hypothetical protein